ncbi:unnamed protein product (macronuclear) [Paramecium tetraurelia]|uniref:Uncharacterized protein n=1 Tax=Paramecium tetraurelia TaxID=5888 RepID=A0DUM2_PARTE|nr:uncharacterized protein GSPATT00020411001 [Paramecium tetraurelia]CAK86739.1 unnamed protein product [Paramecium tetraurelia]|eukprot:XP_001454136.1 hypothetical protein (macronuclear) [Paramecium tetraurelia strain d4-2]
MHSQPLIKIEVDHKPKMMLQLPDQLNLRIQQSFSEIPKKNRKSSQVSLNSLEVSPKITKMNQNKKDQKKYKDLSELQKSHCQFKKSLNKVKKSHLGDNNCEINTIHPNSSFYLNGVKLPYSLYIINKNRQMAIANLINQANPHAYEQSQQQIQMIDNQIKQVRIENQSKQKLKDYRSRSYLQNAYYSMLCVNSDSKKRLKKIIHRQFPQESRFQQL